MNLANIGAQRVFAAARQGARFVPTAEQLEAIGIGGLYAAHYFMPVAPRLDEFISLRDELGILLPPNCTWAKARTNADRIAALQRRIREIPQELVWEDTFHNLVTTEGKNAILTHFLKGSSYTASQVLGLIEDTGYTAVAAGNTAASITAVGGGSPANGWNEAPVGTCSVRQTPSFGTASAGSLAASATSHSMLATDTIKGAFLMARSTAGTAPTTTVGNTSGALYSAGLFSGGDQVVSNGGTLQVTYTASA